MLIKKIILISIPVLFLLNCSNSTSDIEENPQEEVINDTTETSNPDSIKDELSEIKGMFLVRASSEAVLMGTNSKEANASERPQMKVVLNYDYLLSRNETTCGDFVTTMKKYGTKDSFANSVKCDSDSLPIANITFYDAVLFANALSKANTMDSVYEYSRTTMDEDGHCTNLQGFLFHPEKQGFRLPTEAEWIKAANQKWDPSNSWNNANSNYKAHKVCTKNSASEQFCDMAGNVMEWANDWLGNFKDTTVTNYAGAPDAGELGERIVKGGAFNTDEASINTYSRGDVYTVTSSTRADYVGFRLAYGAIPNPVWMDSEGKTAESIITSLATSFDIYTYTKSYNVKLAFRNDVTGNLAFIDYTSGLSNVQEIQDTISVYHPEISPNGEQVAFSTIPEGITGKSNLYVRNLDKDGSGLVKLDVESAAIPRWRVIGNDTVIVYVTSAGNNKTEATWKGYSTWQVPFSAGKFGKPSKIMEGSFHGGISEDRLLAVTGSSLLRSRINGWDSLWYNGEQACNVSMAQDGSKRTAFLDFSGKTGREYIGEKYGTHKYLLVADSNGKLVQYAKAPSGYTFDHTEWAVGATNENVVATLTNTNGAHKRITLINLAEGITTDLAEGEELWHPSFWIKAKKKYIPASSSAVAKSSSSSAATSSSSEVSDETNSSAVEEESSSSEISAESSSSTEAESSSSESESAFTEGISYELDPDSAGMYYNTSGASKNAASYRYKMEFLWQYKDSVNVVIMGSSRSSRGVNPTLFSKPILAMNLAIDATNITGHNTYFVQYVLPHVKNLKTLVISIDPDRGRNTGLNANNMFYEAYKSYPGYVYDMNHNFWKGANTSALFEITYESPGISSLSSKIRPTRGFYPTNSNGWGDPVITEDSCWMDYAEYKYLSNLSTLENLIQTCQENKIILIGVLFPINPKYKETGAYGYAGLRRSDVPKVINDLENLTKTYTNFILFDENKMGDHDYTDEMASDYSHLSSLGAEQLTHRLDSLIQTLNIDWEN